MSAKVAGHRPRQFRELKAHGVLDMNMDRVASQHAEALEAAVAQTAIAEMITAELNKIMEGSPVERPTLPESLRRGLNGHDLEAAALPANLNVSESLAANKIAVASLKHWKPSSR